MRIPGKDFRVGIIMKCGYVAPGTLKFPGQEAFVGCGVHGCQDVAEAEPDLTGRMARCSCGGNERPSSLELAFFRHRPEREYDEYYCGCFGWD